MYKLVYASVLTQIYLNCFHVFACQEMNTTSDQIYGVHYLLLDFLVRLMLADVVVVVDLVVDRKVLAHLSPSK